MERYSQISQVTEYKLRKKTENLKSKKKKKSQQGYLLNSVKASTKKTLRTLAWLFFFLSWPDKIQF